MRTAVSLQLEIRRLISFYFPQCLDPAGGFFDCFDAHGRVVPNARRHLVSCARMVINHARAASVLQEPSLLEGVHHGLRFLRQAHRDGDGGYAWILEGGRPLDPTRHCYGLAFVLLAYARAASAGVAGMRPWIDEVWSVLSKRFREPQSGLFADEADAQWQLSGYRGQNANMHLCEALISVHEATGEGAWLERASHLAERVVRGLAMNDRGWIWEHFDERWQPDWACNRFNRDSRYRSWGYQPGHQLEWAKLLLVLERHQPSPWRTARAQQLFEEAMRAGWDAEHGGVVYALDPDLRWHDTDKYGWVQAEALAAAGLLARATGEARYAGWFERLEAYITAHVIDPATRTWHRTLQRDGQPRLDRRALEGKSDYHSLGALCDLVQWNTAH